MKQLIFVDSLLHCPQVAKCKAGNQKYCTGISYHVIRAISSKHMTPPKSNYLLCHSCNSVLFQCIVVKDSQARNPHSCIISTNLKPCRYQTDFLCGFAEKHHTFHFSKRFCASSDAVSLHEISCELAPQSNNSGSITRPLKGIWVL